MTLRQMPRLCLLVLNLALTELGFAEVGRVGELPITSRSDYLE